MSSSAAATATATSTTPAVSDATKGTAKPRAKSAPKAKKTRAVDPQVICDKFASQVMDRYSLESEVMTKMTEVVHAVLTGYHIYNEQQSAPVGAVSAAASTDGESANRKKAAGPKKPRKTSAYNCYVKKMMQDPGVKPIPQKEKMAAIGRLWATLPEAGRAEYEKEAAQLNASVDTAT